MYNRIFKQRKLKSWENDVKMIIIIIIIIITIIIIIVIISVTVNKVSKVR